MSKRRSRRRGKGEVVSVPERAGVDRFFFFFFHLVSSVVIVVSFQSLFSRLQSNTKVVPLSLSVGEQSGERKRGNK